MPRAADIVRRVRARVSALQASQWIASAGKRFLSTVATISDFSQQNIRLAERTNEAPDVLWETLKERSSKSLLNAAEEEQKKISNELARQTLKEKARQEQATADRMESEARIIKITEVQARLVLFEKLQDLSVVPVWNAQGQMLFLKVSSDYDWEGLREQLITGNELVLPTVSPKTPEAASSDY